MQHRGLDSQVLASTPRSPSTGDITARLIKRHRKPIIYLTQVVYQESMTGEPVCRGLECFVDLFVGVERSLCVYGSGITSMSRRAGEKQAAVQQRKQTAIRRRMGNLALINKVFFI